MWRWRRNRLEVGETRAILDGRAHVLAGRDTRALRLSDVADQAEITAPAHLLLLSLHAI